MSFRQLDDLTPEFFSLSIISLMQQELEQGLKSLIAQFHGPSTNDNLHCLILCLFDLFLSYVSMSGRQ